MVPVGSFAGSTMEVNPDTGDRTVTYGVPNVYMVSYYDKLVGDQAPDPYEGIPTPKAIVSYKVGAAFTMIVVGVLVFAMF